MTNPTVDPGPVGSLDETLPKDGRPQEAPASKPAQTSGELLEGRFKVLRLLGKGAMGAVFLAEDQMLGGSPLVLKLMTAHETASFSELEQFRREVLSARSVLHPNVVRVFDYHILDGVPAITMEYLPGGTLEELRKLTPPVIRWLKVLVGVADALQAIHSSGIIHRDLKPQNIILGADGQPRVTDFGIARKTAGVEQYRQCYTPMYAAPEQIRDEKLDTRTDIYAFGAMAFHLLSGQPPFPRDATLEGHLNYPVPSLKALVEGLPGLVDQLVRRCMAKDPRDRPDAETVARQLREAVAALEPSREASVLRIDLVAYPTWMTQQHQGAIHEFTEILAECPEVKGATPAELLKSPLRDGVVLVFLRSADAAYRAALGVAKQLKARELAARIGLHHGSVKLVTDLNAQASAVGGGVLMCERIMSCGSPGHILASEKFVKALLAENPAGPHEFEGPYVIDDSLGGAHGVFNVRTDGLGQEFNPPARAPTKLLKGGPFIALGLVGASVAVLGWVATSLMRPGGPNPVPVLVQPGPVAAPIPSAPVAPLVARPPSRPAAEPAGQPVPVKAVEPRAAVPSPTPPAAEKPRKSPGDSTAPRKTSVPKESVTKPAREPGATPSTPAPVAAAPAPRAEPPPPKVEEPRKPDQSAAAKEALQEASQSLRTGDFEGAVAKALSALKMDASLSPAHKLLGTAYARLRKYCESKTHYQKYLELNPTADNAPGVRKALEARDYQACP